MNHTVFEKRYVTFVCFSAVLGCRDTVTVYFLSALRSTYHTVQTLCCTVNSLQYNQGFVTFTYKSVNLIFDLIILKNCFK